VATEPELSGPKVNTKFLATGTTARTEIRTSGRQLSDEEYTEFLAGHDQYMV
jgi:hypothetical protein